MGGGILSMLLGLALLLFIVFIQVIAPIVTVSGVIYLCVKERKR